VVATAGRAGGSGAYRQHGRPQAECCDGGRDDDRPQAGQRDAERVEDPEDAAEGAVVAQPLEQRHAGHVDQRVGDADDRQRGVRHEDARQRTDHRDRQAPER
jgi:hypothetical protein